MKRLILVGLLALAFSGNAFAVEKKDPNKVVSPMNADISMNIQNCLKAAEKKTGYSIEKLSNPKDSKMDREKQMKSQNDFAEYMNKCTNGKIH